MEEDKFTLQVLEKAKILLNIGFESLHSAAELLKSGTKDSYSIKTPDLKTGVMSAANALEYLFKAMIVAKDWRQIAENRKNFTYEQFVSDNWNSLKISSCLSTIESVYGIKFNRKIHERQREVSKIRNTLAHYHYKVDIDRLMEALAGGIDLFINLYRSHLPTLLKGPNDPTIDVDILLMGVPQYMNVRLQTISSELQQYQRPRTYHLSECYRCEQDANIISEDRIICLYCRLSNSIEELAIERGENTELRYCSDCRQKSMFNNYKTDNECWECILCGAYTKTPTYVLLWKINVTTENNIRIDL